MWTDAKGADLCQRRKTWHAGTRVPYRGPYLYGGQYRRYASSSSRARCMTYVPLACPRPEVQDAPLLSKRIRQHLPHRPYREISDQPAQKLIEPVKSLRDSSISHSQGRMTANDNPAAATETEACRARRAFRRHLLVARPHPRATDTGSHHENGRVVRPALKSSRVFPRWTLRRGHQTCPSPRRRRRRRARRGRGGIGGSCCSFRESRCRTTGDGGSTG